MADVPGLKCSVYFGDATAPLPDWRHHAEDASEADDPTVEELAGVVAVLGFDPRNETLPRKDAPPAPPPI